MKKENLLNKTIFIPLNVVICTKEPSRDCLWIYPHDNIIDIKIFYKTWKLLLTSKDLGLSELSLNQVNSFVLDKISKESNRASYNEASLLNQINDLKDRVKILEQKVNDS